MPLTNLPNSSYVVIVNGFQLDPNTTETLGISGQPVKDSAGRTIAYTVWKVRLRTILYAALTNDTTTDFQMNSARQLILSPGGSFYYKDRGFGELEINTGKRQKDVKWGPFVEEISWKPWGDTTVGELEFVVTVTIPECNSAKFEGKPMEWNYSVEYTLEDGYTTRSINGHLIIPQTRDTQANRQFRHSADEYREKITPAVPGGFRRKQPMTFKLSEDKCRLDFHVEDEELGPNIPPPGVLRVDADMVARNTEMSAFQQMTYTLRATYEMCPGFPAQVALAHYQKFCLDRQEATKRRVKANRKGIKGIVRTFWEVREPKIIDRIKVGGFSASWIVTFGIRDLLAVGFWRQVPDGNNRLDWDKWQASIGAVVNDPRGLAGLKFNPLKDDIIMDLCNKDVGQINQLRKKPVPLDNDSTLRGAKARTTPDADMVEFKQSFRLDTNGSTYIHKPLNNPQTNTLRSVGAPSPTTNTLRTPNLISAGKVFADPSDSAVDTDTIAIVGERATPTYWLVHTGRAIRVGDVFPCPILTKIGDMTLVPANRRGDGYVSQWGSGLWENLYFCRWRMTYLLQGRPGTGTAGPNPIFNEGPGDHGDDDVTEDPNGDWDVSGDDQINTLRSSTGGLPF